MNPDKRIEELESQVETLTCQVRTLLAERDAARAKRRGIGGDIGGGIWCCRFLLVVMTVVVGFAAAVMVGSEGLATRTELDIRLLSVGLLALAAMAFYFARWWLTFTALSALAVYLTYALCFLEQPEVVVFSETSYFGVSLGFLTLCYALSSLACILENRRRTRRRLAAAVAANSAVYLVFALMAVRAHYPGFEWALWLALAGLFGVLAVLAEARPPTRNYVFQLFLAQTVVASTLALQLLLPREKLLVAMALECLVLVLFYAQTGVVLFKALDLVLLVVVFVGTLGSLDLDGTLRLGGIEASASWFAAVGVSAAFFVAAWAYEHVVHDAEPDRRALSGHWFGAGAVLDVKRGAAGALHAAGGALVLIALTINHMGDSLLLPYVLAAEGAAAAALGLLTAAPQIEAAGVLLLVGGHTSYYVLLTRNAAFSQQAGFVPFTFLLVLLTFLGGARWERVLERINGPRSWDYYVPAAAPYLLATATFAALSCWKLEGVFGPLAQDAFGLALLLAGAVFHSRTLQAAGLLALAAGAATFWTRLHRAGLALTEQPFFWMYLCLTVSAYVAAERFWRYLRQHGEPRSKLLAWTRTVLVFTAAGLCAAALRRGVPQTHLSPALLVLALACALVGIVFAENRYRWAALLIVTGTLAHTFSRDLTGVSPMAVARVVLGTVIVLAALSVPWFRSMGRRRRREALATDSGEGASHDE
ncbi:MAG TPA: hypothetical protein HPP77_07675 [Candidatus Hydrogenedentes bacterium]|nr:hypothetical protein [Candidatus Hydrogenedentota bacterium]HIJ72552.1 hypothetical protein [Candidatus Hydrogenedentota bacterium]